MPGPLAAGMTIIVGGTQAHYLGQVMRRRPGDMVRLFDGVSGEFAGRVVSQDKRALVLTLEMQTLAQEPLPDLWLCFAPLKRAPMEWLVEKACELGVGRLQPVITRRTVVDRMNTGRLQALLVEAAEQCGRTALPELAEPVALTALLAGWQGERRLVFADEAATATAPPLAAVVAPGPAALLIGPEGGFLPEEAAAIRAIPQAVAVSLGPRILRAETAGISALAVWQALSIARPPLRG